MNTQKNLQQRALKKQRYETFELKEKGKLIITEEVQNKIEQAHQKIGSTEWCGFIFYDKVEGKVADPSTLVLKTTDIYFMDVGSSAYTESDNDTESIVAMVDRVPAYMTSSYGLIHTHHNMKAYFSATDIDELHENVHNYEQYLSLIVNFDGNWVAKIAKLITIEGGNYTIEEEGEDPVTMKTPDKQVMITFDLEIEKEKSFKDDIVELRLNEILEEKRKAEEKRKKAQQSFRSSCQTNIFNQKDFPYGHYYNGFGFNDTYNKSVVKTESKVDPYIEEFICAVIYQDVTVNESMTSLKEAIEDYIDYINDPDFNIYMNGMKDSIISIGMDLFGNFDLYSSIVDAITALQPYKNREGVDKLLQEFVKAKEELNYNNEYAL